MSASNSAIIDSNIKATNQALSTYNDGNTYYNNIIDKLKYNEFNSYNEDPALVDIGCICNTEYTSFSFNADRYWDKDSTSVSIKNAHKLINDLEWTEQSSLHNGTIQSKPGMVVLAKGADEYNADNDNCVNYFNDIAEKANGPTDNFNTYSVTSGGNGTAIDLFGYLHPDATGTWKISIPSSNPGSNLYTYLWVGDTALYDYSKKNANINPTTPTQTNQTISATFKMNKDDYIPFRIQIISKNAKLNTNNVPIFTVTPPSNSAEKGVITNNPGKGWDYFVTFVKGGAVYYKNLLYFGLVQSNADSNKFDSFFVSTNSENAKNIRNYKANPQLQYVKVVIPTPTMTGSNSINVMDGSPLNIVFVKGVTITIKKAIYGMPDPIYYYTTYTIKKEPQTVTIPTTTETIKTASKDPLVTNEDTITTQGYTKQEIKEVTVPNPPTAVNQQIDVTAQLQKMVSADGNELKIKGGNNNFYNLFGNPIKDPNDPNINVAKTLFIEYSYKVDESIISDKYIYLDPNNGLITVGATFYDNSITTPMSMDSSSFCSGDRCKNYSMGINEKGELFVKNENNTQVGYIDLKKYTKTKDPNFSLEKCKVNNEWLNSNIETILLAGKSTSFINGKKIKSPDSRFKLEFENRKLIFTYCITPYTQLNNGMRYTTTFNTSNMNNAQIYYLYRINTRGIFGRKFLEETDKNTQDTIMHYLPNTHNNILLQSQDPNSFTKIFSYPTFPLFKDGALAFNTNYNANITGAKTYTDCANQCIAEPNNRCEHFFFVSNNDGSTNCYTDKVADANPVYSINKTNSNSKNSDLYKKPYTIKSTCGKMADMQPIISRTKLSEGAIDYRIPENAPNLTYYCGLDRFKKDVQGIFDIYGTDNTRKKDGNNGSVSCNEFCASDRWGGFTGQCTETINNDKSNNNSYQCADVPSSLLGGNLTNVSCKCDPKEKMTNMTREGMTSDSTSGDYYNKYGPHVNTNIANRFPILNKITRKYSESQDKIGAQYDDTIDKLGKYEAVLQSMASPQYNYNGTDSLIPDKFQNNKNTKPNISYVDGAKKDVGIMLMQQNTMYTLASIVAATCLIFSVAFTGSLE